MTARSQDLFTEFDEICAKGFGFKGDRFSRFALKLFAYQFENNPSYQRICQFRGKTPGQVEAWQDIPALHTDAFKLPNYPIRTQESTTYFLSSGTSGEIRARHEFPELDSYHRSILSGWQAAGLPTNAELLFLAQHPSKTPHSSLGHMMGVLHASFSEHAESRSPFLINGEMVFDLSELKFAIERNHPILLFGTALAFLNLIEGDDCTYPLPDGSMILETGGYKGSGRTLEKEEFYHLMAETFHVSTDQIWNEYSMTELSSQAYTRGLGSTHKTPPWMKIQVLDLETRLPVNTGETGFLLIHDLANLHSCAAIETQDLATYHGEHEFTLIGRDPEALPRGCSRALDYLLNS